MKPNMSMLPKFLQAYIYDIDNEMAHNEDLYARLNVIYLELLRKVFK